MPPWQKLLLKSLGVGIGIGVGIAVAVGVYAWYASQPVPQKPWDASAITASFFTVDTIGTDNHLRFVYILENHTGQDYRVNTSALLLSAVVRAKDSLTGGKFTRFLDDDIFIPAKQHAQVKIELPDYHFSGTRPPNDNQDDRKKYKDAVKRYVSENISQLNGFAAFDDTNRYRINFLNGWQSTTE